MLLYHAPIAVESEAVSPTAHATEPLSLSLSLGRYQVTGGN